MKSQRYQTQARSQMDLSGNGRLLPEIGFFKLRVPIGLMKASPTYLRVKHQTVSQYSLGPDRTNDWILDLMF